MQNKRELAVRIGMLSLAVLFLVTSVFLSIFVIWQQKQQSDAEKAINASQSEQTAQEENTTETASKVTPEEDKLEGTQLAGFTPSEDQVKELKIEDTVPGTGEEVKKGATITAHYTGALVKTGVIFQSSKDSGQPFTSPLNQLIEGWQKGIPGMKVGGTRRLTIPAAQAYGERGQAGIPANSDLVFDIELVSVK